MSSETVTQALKPCECGGTAEIRVSSDGEAEWCRCTQCGVEGAVHCSRIKAITAWNARHRAPDAEPVATYRHVKRGTTYAVIGEAELQCAVVNPVEGDLLTIYRGEDGKLWARFRDEFHDGRFERIEDTHPAEPVADDEETYRIGVDDGRQEMAREIDLATGGDGEFRYCTDHDADRHCPDADAMKARIIDRFTHPAEPAQAVEADWRGVAMKLHHALAQHTAEGCPLCPGDCSSANPPMYNCPTQAAIEADRAFDAALASMGERRPTEPVAQAVEALDMACDLIQEAKGAADGPDGGYVTNHLDDAENWIGKARAALAAMGERP